MAPANRKVGKAGGKLKKSEDALNDLFAKNLGRRYRRKKMQLPALPPNLMKSILSSDSSLHVLKRDTPFDELIKGPTYKEVDLTNHYYKPLSSDSEISRSQIMPKIIVASRTPIITQNRKKRKSDEISSKMSQSENKSMMKMPSIQESLPSTTMETSVMDNFFSKTFRERQCIQNSTPLVELPPRKKIIEDSALSPIHKFIRSWDSDFPLDSINISKQNSKSKLLENADDIDWKFRVSPKVYLTRLRAGERKTNYNKENLQPRVYLTPIKLNIEKTDIMGTPMLKGFTQEQVDSAEQKSQFCRTFIKSPPANIKNNDKHKNLSEDLFASTNSSYPSFIEISSDNNNSKSLCGASPVKSNDIIESTPKRCEIKASDRFITRRRQNCEQSTPSVAMAKPPIGNKDDSDLSPLPKTEAISLLRNIDKVSDTIESPVVVLRNCALDFSDEDIIDTSDSCLDLENKILNGITNNPLKCAIITLKPGKSYRRSLSLLRRSIKTNVTLENNAQHCSDDCICFKCIANHRLTGDHQFDKKKSIFILPAVEESPITRSRKTDLSSYALGISCYEPPESPEPQNQDNVTSTRRRSVISGQIQEINLSARDIILRRCGQDGPIHFQECYPEMLLKNCQKIGEGVYGEVFLYRNQNRTTSVMKVIPIEGDRMVNGEKQKKFEEILSEVMISMELSKLRNGTTNMTSAFNEVQSVKCVQGRYPDRLLELWEIWDECHTSENESPEFFTPEQLYIILELSDGGKDYEAFLFNNAAQVLSIIEQTACALAVAECELKFEHRDLHWGNLLVKNVSKTKKLLFYLEDQEIVIQTRGVELAIIDFTLSRAEFDGVVIFNDLGQDEELFMAKGDYQFDIYRLMQERNHNEWRSFEPYSNILWLHYVLDKAINMNGVRYKNPNSKLHLEHMEKLEGYYNEILTFQSATDFVKNNFLL